MSELLAPNGKPSNLTPEQYKLVRTPEFKAWFGDWENDPANASKIIDEETKEPLIVYHGSQSSFTTFDISLSGKSNDKASVGFWFTPIKSFANNFAESVWYGNKNLTTYEVFLSIKNPKIYVKGVDNLDKIKDLSKKLVPLENEVDYIMNEKWRDDYKDYQVLMYAIKGVINTSNMADYLRTKNSIEVIKDGIKYNEIQIKISKIRDEINDLRYSDSYEKFRTDIHKIEGGNSERANTGGLGMTLKNGKKTILEYKQSLINKDFDGIIIEQTRFDRMEAGGVNTQFVAFESNQIKLADGTNTTFDGSNPDIRFDKGGEVYFDDLSEKSKEIIESNYDDSFGFFDFNWNNESKRENFREWLKEFEEKQFSENLDKVIGYVKSDIELIKNKNLLQLKLKAFEELIIPSLGNEVLLPKLSKFEEMVLLYSDATIESIEKGFKDAKNIIDEDGSINQSKIAPSNMFKGDYISIPAFERFVKNNPEYKGVFNDWEKIYNEEMDLSFKETYAFRYPSLEDLEYLHSELVELKDKKSKDKFNTGGEVNTGLFSQIWEWFGIKF